MPGNFDPAKLDFNVLGDREIAGILIRQYSADDDVLERLLEPEELELLESGIHDDLTVIDGWIADGRLEVAH